MLNSKYIKDIRLETGEFYIAKKIKNKGYKIIYSKGTWGFSNCRNEIVPIEWILITNGGKYKAKEINKLEAFMEMI